MNHLVTITKSDGTHQLFEEEKLMASLRRVGATQEAIDSIVESVEKEMWNGMSTSEIYSKAFSLLKRRDKPVAIKYSIRRAMLELGPDGFPFEKFVSRIFELWGYETLTDQTVLGSCVDHEMDVIAWKGDDLIMCEAKYHNEYGLRSDIKVVLYVKARFDDLQGVIYDFGGKQRKLSEGWLITNTKFTDRAIHYGVCKKLKMVGWNYPADGSLHKIIEENGLHPITTVTSLTKFQKKDLIGRGVLTCRDILKRHEFLREIGVKEMDIGRIISEAELITRIGK